jgi:CDP-diacylglycerol--glycerol-3-phosphate 3-phosphatidyltransferase
LITDRLRSLLAPTLRNIAGALSERGIQPVYVTAAPPLVSCVVVAPLVAEGYLLPGIIIAASVLPLDAIDGALARRAGRPTLWGRYVDVMADRICDAALWVGTMIYGARTGTPSAVATYAVAYGAWNLASQSTVLAEAVGARIDLGPIQRTEKLLLLFAGLMLAAAGVQVGLSACAVAITVGSVMSVAARGWRVWRAISHGQ